MNQLGYEGILLQRQDDFGLATFWDTSSFQLLAQKHATLHHLAETHLQVSLNMLVISSKIRHTLSSL